MECDKDMQRAVHQYLEIYGSEVKRMQVDVVFFQYVSTLLTCGVIDALGADAI